MCCIMDSRGRKDLKDCKAPPALRVAPVHRVLLALRVPPVLPVLPAPMVRTVFLLQ